VLLTRPPSTEPERLLSVTRIPSARGRAVLEVVGEVDTFTAPLLGACIRSRTDRPGLRMLVVDLARVTFLGAAGASVLARAHRRCREVGARLVVRGAGRPLVVRMLRLAGLPVEPTPDGGAAPRSRARSPLRPVRARGRSVPGGRRDAVPVASGRGGRPRRWAGR
jgi:anti-sigma B factor antagonist